MRVILKMSEDESMNERDAQHLWTSYGNSHGCMTVLENVGGASVPDLLFMSGGMIMFMEMKKLYGGKYIYCGQFQWGYANKIKNQIHPYQHHYVVADLENNHIMFNIYTVPQIKTISPVSISYGSKLKFSISSLVPIFVVRSESDFVNYLDYLQKMNFGE